MKVVSIACNNCGAPLDVPLNTRYLTCSFCESRLEVQKSGNAYFTSVLEAMGELQKDVSEIKVQSELARLDREWEIERGELLVTDEHGRASVPSSMHLVGSLAVAAFGVGWTVLAASMFPPFAFFGVVFVIAALVTGVLSQRKAGRYAAGRRRWERRRRDLLRGLGRDA